MPINRLHTALHTHSNICALCGTTETLNWYNVDEFRICMRCYQSDRNYLYGTLDPSSTIGIAVITEHVVYAVLDDCIKCNTEEHFNYEYDLVSEKYGTINVKSSTLLNTHWRFGKHEFAQIPDYYICLGLNENRTEILKAFIIPGSTNIVGKYGIFITNTERGLSRVSEYEVDPTPYNEVYQNLDITTLPEFSNYKE